MILLPCENFLVTLGKRIWHYKVFSPLFTLVATIAKECRRHFVQKKFALGRLVMTRTVHEKMELDPYFAVGVLVSLHRYCAGDWGDLCEGDKAENEKAIKDGERIFALYNIGNEKIYIITEWDRSVTTILFPYEY